MNNTLEVNNKTLTKYVVLRGGIRVSDKEYSDKSDATEEVLHWNRIASRWPDKNKITVEEYNEEAHRIF